MTDKRANRTSKVLLQISGYATSLAGSQTEVTGESASAGSPFFALAWRVAEPCVHS